MGHMELIGFGREGVRRQLAARGRIDGLVYGLLLGHLEG
jgi:hypothetical protein